jgi:hypothetical protein
MTLVSALMTLVLAAVPGEKPATVVQAPDSPVRLDRATILTGADGPPVVLYAATNLTDDQLEQFTVMAFIFKAEGTLKARQVAPARRTLDARGAKYSTMVLDGSAIDPTDVIVVGVNQVQRAGSEVWWRADLQAAAQSAAQSAVPKKKP